MEEYITIEEFEMSHLDYLLIEHVKTLRGNNGLTQQELSQKMGLALSFVGNVENINERHKYSIRHIALLAKAFNYKSITKLFDFPFPEYDKIKIRVSITKENYSISKEGISENKTRVLKSEILEIVPIN